MYVMDMTDETEPGERAAVAKTTTPRSTGWSPIRLITNTCANLSFAPTLEDTSIDVLLFARVTQSATCNQSLG